MSVLDEFFSPEVKTFLEKLVEYVRNRKDNWISVKKTFRKDTYDITVEFSIKKVKIEGATIYIYLDDYAAPDIEISNGVDVQFGSVKFTLKDIVVEVEPYVARLIMYGVKWNR